MKKVRKKNKPESVTGDRDVDDMPAEIDLAKLGPGVREKYYLRAMAGTNLAKLDRDVREAFPTDEAVNKAL